MKTLIYIFLLFFVLNASYSQVLNWSSATRTGSAPNYTYTGTGIKAVISSNALTFGDGTPRVDNTSGIGACYSGLGLYAGFFNSYVASTNSHITTTFSFASGFGCTDMTLVIKDINSGESFTDFCDVLEISATYNNAGTALPTASIATTLASNVTRVNSGTTVKLIGHSNSSETVVSASSGAACGNTTVKVTPPSGFPLKTITIKYRPAYGTSTSNAYYNSNPKPAAQYVSYSNLSFVATAGCSQLLPIELVSFNAKRINNEVKLDWKTASEKDNDFFTVERSLDGINFQEITKITGAKNSLKINSYEAVDENPSNEVSYYRLKQTDLNNEHKYSDIVSVDNDYSKMFISHVFPNPTSSDVSFDFYTPISGEFNYQLVDLTGRIIVEKTGLVESGHSIFKENLEELPSGIYFMKVFFDKINLVSVNKIIKN